MLENLGCTGSEDRLLDCPRAEMSDPLAADSMYAYGTAPYGLSDYIVGRTYYGELMQRSCSPEIPGSYAFVACGALTSPGASPAPPIMMRRSLSLS